MRISRADSRDAITLLEVIVVVAIMTILVGLLVPAVQKARAAAARMECANHVRQLGIAHHGFHQANRSLPPGMGNANPKTRMRLSSWLTHLLPHVEQQNLWSESVAAYAQQRNPLRNPPHTPMATVVPVFTCPADGRVTQPQFAPRDRIQVAFTSYLGVSGRDYSTLDGCFFRDSRIRLADISDGTSNTVLAGERPPSTDFQFGWWYAGAGQKFTGSADMLMGVEEQNLLLVTAGSCPPGTYRFAPGRFSNQCDMFHFWSPHESGAHFLFADGSVRFLSYSAAPLLPALASRAGGEVAVLPN